MSDRTMRLFQKNSIAERDIKYLTHSQQHTVLHLLAGREIQTSIPLKTVAAQLSPEEFWSIQKGVVVAARYVVHIDSMGVYTMVDGQRFKGRGRLPSEHSRRRKVLETASSQSLSSRLPLPLLEKCTIMEDAPIAFCVIELVFNKDGHSIDFIFRYCNKEMEVLEGVPVSEMLNRSFYEVFPNGDRKWIVPYADVALNGTRRILRDFSPEVNKFLVIRCYQPLPGYCACLLTEEEG